MVELDEALGLALGGGEVDACGGGLLALVDVFELADEVVGGVDAGLGLRGAGLGAAAEPLRFGFDAVLQSLLELALSFEVLLLAFEESTVGAADAEETVGVDAVELDDVTRDIFEEVAVVRDHDAGEGGGLEGLFEPRDAGEVKVVGGLVEEEDVGGGDDGFGDGEALAPASGEGGGLGGGFGEADAAAGFAESAFAFGFGDCGGGESGFEDIANGETGSEGGLLADVADAGALADCDFAGVGVFFGGEDLEKGGFASAVGSDEADAVAVGDGEGDFGEEGDGAEALGDALSVQNRRHSPVYQGDGAVRPDCRIVLLPGCGNLLARNRFPPPFDLRPSPMTRANRTPGDTSPPDAPPLQEANMKYTLPLSLLLLSTPLSAFAGDTLLPAGSLIQCTISEPKLSSKTDKVGDPVLCQVSHAELYGRATIPYGSYLVGHFEDYKDPGHFVGKGWIELKFDRLVVRDEIVPLDARVVAVPKYPVDQEGRIHGTGHPVRDTVEWFIPVLWPIDLINLPRRGPRVVLKPETKLTLKVMDDVGLPSQQRAAVEQPYHQPALIERNYDQTPNYYPQPQPAYYPPQQTYAAPQQTYAAPQQAPQTIIYNNYAPPQGYAPQQQQQTVVVQQPAPQRMMMQRSPVVYGYPAPPRMPPPYGYYAPYGAPLR